MEKCYKLHRYPPGYKTKGKGLVANQVFVTNFGANVVAVTDEMSHFQLSQIQAQCQQLLVVLNTKSLLPNTPKPSTSNVTNQAMANTTSSSSLPIHSMSGKPIYNSLCIHSIVFITNLSHSIFASNVKFPMVSNNQWVIETGVTDHMVYSLSCLTTVTSTINASVELPNVDFVSVTHIGTVQFSPSLTLTNVL